MRWRLGCVVMFAALLVSCGGKEPSPTSDGVAPAEAPEAEKAQEVIEPDLPADASPTQVAEALFQALDADDGPRLRGLAARRTIAEDLNRLGRGRLRFSETKAVQLAVAGWGATYAFIEAGSASVSQERITGGRASVFVDCRNRADGLPRRLEVELAREGPGWRVKRLVPKGFTGPPRR